LLSQKSTYSSNEEEEATLESLSERLSRLVLQSDDPTSAQQELLRTRLPLILGLNRTRVAKSATVGRGLFANQDCAAGDLLTCYPGDGLVSTGTDENSWTIDWGSHVSATNRKQFGGISQNNPLFLGYVLFVSEDYGVLGLSALDEDPAYLGHFANDGGTMPVSERELSIYVLESSERSNAMHQGISGDAHMVTVATRDIKAGEEIFVTYGPEYWREQPSFNTTGILSETTAAGKPTPGSVSGKGFG